MFYTTCTSNKFFTPPTTFFTVPLLCLSFSLTTIVDGRIPLLLPTGWRKPIAFDVPPGMLVKHGTGNLFDDLKFS